MKKAIILLLAISVVSIFIVSIFPWKTNVDTNISGIQSKSNDIDEVEKITLSIKGTYKDYLFRSDSFEGEIEISNYDILEKYETMDITFNDGYGLLQYITFDKQSEDLFKSDMVGMIMCKSDFSKVLIMIPEDGVFSDEEGVFISAPADDRAESLEVVRELVNKKSNTYKLGLNIK